MPITKFLSGQSFDPETKRIMDLAFEMTCEDRKYAGRTAPLADEMIAKKIIALVVEGMRDPILLCEWALYDVRNPPPRARSLPS
jgi:hypothetical protein